MTVCSCKLCMVCLHTQPSISHTTPPAALCLLHSLWGVSRLHCDVEPTHIDVPGLLRGWVAHAFIR